MLTAAPQHRRSFPRAGIVSYGDVSSLRGLGDANTTAAQITSTGGAVATTAVTATTAASTAAVAVPIIGAAVLAVTLILTSIAKKNAQKSAATSVANEVEPQLKANLEGYFSGPRTIASRQRALENFDYGWSLVLQNCGNPQLGSAGRRCIEERQQGGIAPWCPTADHRGCDWFTLYRLPIELDAPNPDVYANAAAELFGVTLTPEQQKMAPRYLAFAALALGAMLL